MSSSRLPLKPGDVIASKYRVEHMLGAGAMGLVAAATYLETGFPVAIKCLLPHHAQKPSLVRRFHREAYAATRLRSEHTVRVFDFGTLERADGLPYFVMERLDGTDLSTLLSQRGSLRPYVAADYVAQACNALAEAHALGIVHRDIKLGNLFATRADGSELIKVLDFGVAKFSSPNAAGDLESLTVSDTMLGTLTYMAPEQIVDCSEVDARADIWSLGVTLFRLITGVAPFQGEAPLDLALNIVNERAPSLHELRPDIPLGLDAVVQRCLQKRKEDRYGSATALSLALARFASRFSRTATNCEPPTERLASSG